MDDQDSINAQEWARPENWSGWLGTYRSARDRRLWVPKKNPRLGWTLNFAHRGARWACFAPALVPAGFILLFLLHRLSR
jgi:uncharacterized membrane protein